MAGVAVENSDLSRLGVEKLPELDDWDRQLLNYIEQYWFTNPGYFPSEKALTNWGKIGGFDLQQIKLRIAEKVEPYLKYRGIRKEDNKTIQGIISSQLLDARQIAAANLILNYADKRTTDAKLKALGVSPTEWYGWQRQASFGNYLAQRTSDLLEDNKHEANLGLLRAASRGDTNALKLFYQMTGQVKTEETEQYQNLKVVMARFFEMLQLKIKDRELLADIADSFEAMINGSNAVERVLESIGETKEITAVTAHPQPFDTIQPKKIRPVSYTHLRAHETPEH